MRARLIKGFGRHAICSSRPLDAVCLGPSLRLAGAEGKHQSTVSGGETQISAIEDSGPSGRVAVTMLTPGRLHFRFR